MTALTNRYIQLHRDTTIQTLTQQPSVEGGRIVYHPSPLVRAVENGTVLVIDEADKAPTHVHFSCLDGVLHSMMPWSFTHLLRLKRCHVCDQRYSSWFTLFPVENTVSSVPKRKVASVIKTCKMICLTINPATLAKHAERTEGDVSAQKLGRVGRYDVGMVRVFRQNCALEDAIGSHTCSLEALTCV
jgi:hypothetical protein